MAAPASAETATVGYASAASARTTSENDASSVESELAAEGGAGSGASERVGCVSVERPIIKGSAWSGISFHISYMFSDAVAYITRQIALNRPI